MAEENDDKADGRGPAGAADQADDELLDPAQLLSGRTRRRAPHLLYLMESWSDRAEEDVFEFLEATEMFTGMSREELGDVLPLLEPLHVAAGQLVVRQGADPGGIHLVGYGRLRSESEEAAHPLPNGDLGTGATFGEREWITGEPAAVSVRAVRDSLLLRLAPSGMERVTQWHPDVPLRMARSLLRRSSIGMVAGHRSAPASTLAVVPAGREPLPDGFVDALTAALEELSPVHRLSRLTIERELGEGMADLPLEDARNGSLVEWLQRLERGSGIVVYEADTGPTAWTRRCVRQADRLLLVAAAAGSPVRGAVEEKLLAPGSVETGARQELVLLHAPGAAAPSGTARWLRPRAVAAHHHVRKGETDHYRRLARFLTGRAVGVVFGGGGARGSAHLGVVRALEDSGVPIDAVGGTSIGSVAAFMCAMGWDHETRMAKLPAFFSTRLIIQPTLPLVSVSSGRRLQRLIVRETERRSIEDLWIRYFSVSTDLSEAAQVVHRRGDLSTGIRASVSLPGILPPVGHDGHLLVDGGLLNNLPIDVMQDVMGGGRVIAVDLRRPVELSLQGAVGPALSGWQVLLRKLWRGAWRGAEPFDPPSMGAILQRSVELAGLLNDRDLLGRSGLDLYLRPPAGRFGLLDFKSAPLLVDDAYHHTLERLAEAGDAWPAMITAARAR